MVYVFLANGFEESEALCPIDLLRRAGKEVKSVAISTDGNCVTGAHNIKVKADIEEKDFDGKDAEMIVLPGGMPGASNLDASKTVDTAIKLAQKSGAYIGAICAAPMILGHRGILKEKRAVCFPGFEKELDGAKIQSERVVKDGKIITAVGMGAAFEFGLELVGALCGEAKANSIKESAKIK